MTAVLAGCGGGGGSGSTPVSSGGGSTGGSTTASVTSVKASAAQVAPGATVTFTITGSNLSTSMTGNLSGGTCQAPTGTATQLTVSCTAPKSGSSATFTLDSGSAAVSGGSDTIQIQAVPTVSSISTSPSAPIQNSASFTVTVAGSNLSTSMTGSLSGGGTCKAPTGSASSLSFACTAPASGSSTTFTLGDGSTSISGTTTLQISLSASTASYQSGSVQAYMFADMNKDRQECGFPLYQENTILDQAAQAHAQYMVDNGSIVTDTEVAGNPGFTGVTYLDRAQYFGWPDTYVTGGGAGWTMSSSDTNSTAAQAMVGEFSVAVYHQAVVFNTAPYVGIGASEVTAPFGKMEWLASVSIADWGNGSISNSPKTFPCQGVSGVPYVAFESPMPPKVTGTYGGNSAYGTATTIYGNVHDTIVITSASYTDVATGAAVPNIQYLDSATDPNKIFVPFQASVYPSAPLSPNTTYKVVINGTDNGIAFTRTFTFSTGSNAL